MDIGKIGLNHINSSNVGKTSRQKNSEKFSIDNEKSANNSITGLQSNYLISSIDVLIFNESKKKKYKQIKKADEMLDALENLKINIVSGRIDLNNLKNIADKLSQKTNDDNLEDLKLKTILLEVETLAKVEIAKILKLDHIQKEKIRYE